MYSEQPALLLFKRQGFTLVAIMIVVAIISILAAIAIPQFAAYRIRGFNASALSDLRNTTTLELLMYAGVGSFGITDGPVPSPLGVPVYTGSGGGPGNVVTGPAAPGTVNTLTWTNLSPTNVGVTLGLGSSVSLIASTDIPVLPATNLTSFTIIAKHLNGDIYYGTESDVAIVYQDQVIGSNSQKLLPADAIPSIIANDDFAPPTLGPSGNNWIEK